MNQTIRRARWVAAGAVLFQFAGCFGGDPQLFFSTTVANAIVANIVNFLFTLVTDPLIAGATT